MRIEKCRELIAYGSRVGLRLWSSCFYFCKPGHHYNKTAQEISKKQLGIPERGEKYSTKEKAGTEEEGNHRVYMCER